MEFTQCNKSPKGTDETKLSTATQCTRSDYIKMCCIIVSPCEYGYGIKQTANNSIKNIATINTVPQRTKAGGISPNNSRTFSERSSISLDVFFFILFSNYCSYFIVIVPVGGIKSTHILLCQWVCYFCS